MLKQQFEYLRLQRPGVNVNKMLFQVKMGLRKQLEALRAEKERQRMQSVDVGGADLELDLEELSKSDLAERLQEDVFFSLPVKDDQLKMFKLATIEGKKLRLAQLESSLLQLECMHARYN